MKDIFTNVTNSKFNAIIFLQKHGVIPREKLCPGPIFNKERYGLCGQPMILKDVKDRKDSITWRCRKVHKIVVGDQQYVKKDVKVSIREDTWLEHCNLTLEEIILLIYCWANNFTNQQIQHEVRCSDKTVTKWSSFMREACMSQMLDESEAIGGPGIEVEIDESKFGKRKYQKGKQVEGQWVFGGRESKDKSKIFMVPVKKRNRKTLIPIIQKYIKKGSIIHSDCWRPYKVLSKLGYQHVTVNHSKNFKDPKTGACTNRIESDWRHAKVSLPSYGVKKDGHQSYLAEFLWRRKYHNEDLFLTIIEQVNEQYKRKYFTNLP